MGWMIAIAEISLGFVVFCSARPLGGGDRCACFAYDDSCLELLGTHCNLVGWNIALGLAGFVLILPWREWPWVSWRRCNLLTRVLAIVLLVSPALFYVNGLAALSVILYLRS